MPNSAKDDLELLQKRLTNLINHLAPANQPVGDAVALWGFFLERSPSDSNLSRLYLNINFDEYLEFGFEYVKHVELLSTNENPLAGHMVWIARSAEVLHVVARSVQLESAFMQGQITNQFAQGGSRQNPVLPYAQTGPVANNYQAPASGGGCSTLPACAICGGRPQP